MDRSDRRRNSSRVFFRQDRQLHQWRALRPRHDASMGNGFSRRGTIHKRPMGRINRRKARDRICRQNRINLPRHPSQLYEALFEGIFIWLIIFFILRKRSRLKDSSWAHTSSCTAQYGSYSSIFATRLAPWIPIKFVDVDNPIYRLITPWNFSTGQILCFIMIIGGIICLAAFKKYTDSLKIEDKPHNIDMKKLKKKSNKGASKNYLFMVSKIVLISNGKKQKKNLRLWFIMP